MSLPHQHRVTEAGDQLWECQLRHETNARALANVLQAAIVLAEHANSPDIADQLLEAHQAAVRRLQAVEDKAAA